MVERAPSYETHIPAESILGKEIVRAILYDAKESLVGDGSIPPALFLLLESGERGMVPLTLPDTYNQRVEYFAALGSSIWRAGQRIAEVLFISRSWYVSSKGGEGVSPLMESSNHPDSQEAIVIVGRNATRSRQTIVIQPFGRDSLDRPVFGEVEIEEYNARAEKGDLRASGLIDYLFPRRLSMRRRSGF